MTSKQNSINESTENVKPYFRQNNIVIYNDDILNISAIPSNSIDLIVTSPPYNVDVNSTSHTDNLSYEDYLEFTQKKRDGFKCVICGKGIKDGVELHVDHIKPKYLGGESTIENGQTLCAQHNFIKKTLNQTETGKKMFIRLYELAKSEGNEELKKFCTEILKIYEKFNMNCHIVWKK